MGKRNRSQSPAHARKRDASKASATSSGSSSSTTSYDIENESALLSSPSQSSTNSSQALATTSGFASSEQSIDVEDSLSPVPPPRPTPPISSKPVIACADQVTTGFATPETLREPSHDGTVISPLAANNLQYPASTSLMRYPPAEYFPIFKSGDVFIKSDLVSPPKQWQLHSHVLEPLSSFFRNAFKWGSTVAQPSPWYSFTVKKVHDKAQLVKDKATGKRPVIQDLYDGMFSGVTIKVENEDESKDAIEADMIDFDPHRKKKRISMPGKPSKPEAVPETDTTDMTSIYAQIFGTLYNIPPSIPRTSITATLVHAEALIAVATTLGCLSNTHILTSTINNTLSSYRQSLFHAIKKDPARWLVLSLALHNDSIYAESLIHICGAHPSWPWPTKRTVLLDEIQRLVIKKSKELDIMCLEAERDLMLLTIHLPNNKPVCPEENSQFDTWFIVSNFRDILARELASLDKNRKKALLRGTLFRKIFQGGSAYMDESEMRRLMERVMPSAVGNLSEDLNILKGEASEYVKELAENGCLVDVERAGVGWLTCTKVGREDIPWYAGKMEDGES